MVAGGSKWNAGSGTRQDAPYADALAALLDDARDPLVVVVAGDRLSPTLADLAEASQGRTVIVITHDALPVGWAQATWHLADGRLQEAVGA